MDLEKVHEEEGMSDRDGRGLDRIELLALEAALLGAGAVGAAGALGHAGVFAHILWRRRSGALARLP